MRAQRFIPTVVAGALSTLAFSAAPALAVAPETPLTQPATSVTATTAVLHGELNPHAPGVAGEYQFYYRASTEACRPGAESSPEPPGTALGNEKEAVQVEVTGLHPYQTYEFCLIADPESLFIEGPSVSFKTLASKPSIFPETTKATAVTPFAATLGAEVNPNNEQTTYSIEYAQNELLTGAKVLPGTSPLEAEYGERNASVGTGNVLTPETTYYFRVTATNAAGTVEGPIEHFTTAKAEAPIVISENATNAAEPKLEAKINPQYEETKYKFEYSTEESGGMLTGAIHTVAGAATLPGVNEEVAAGPVAVTGLAPGRYFYRAVAENSTSEAKGEIVAGAVAPFEVLAGPAVTTVAAGEPTSTTVAVSGTVTAQGLPSTYHFAYIPLAAYEAARAEGAANPFAATAGRETYDTKLANEREESFIDYAAHPVGLVLEELAPGTTYVYTLVASNELGTQAGSPQTFTTAPAPPPPAPPAPEPAPAPFVPALAPAAILAPLPHSSIAELDAREAKEGKAVNPGKKRGKGHKKKKSKRRRRGTRAKKRKQG